MNDRQYILGLVKQGEHQQQDFKYKVQDARKLARSVSAFANTDGGRLLIGVRDDGHLSGVRSDEEIYMMHQAAMAYCRPAASIKFDTYVIDGRTIVVATVPPSDRKPVCAIGDDNRLTAYIRIADENIVASPVHLAVWRQECAPQGLLMRYTDDDSLLMATFRQHQQLTLNQLVRCSKLPRRQVIGMLSRLVRYNLATWAYDGHQFLFSLT